MSTKRRNPKRDWKSVEIAPGKFFIGAASPVLGRVIEVTFVPPAEANSTAKPVIQYVAHKDGKRTRAEWMDRETLLRRYRELPVVELPPGSADPAGTTVYVNSYGVRVIKQYDYERTPQGKAEVPSPEDSTVEDLRKEVASLTITVRNLETSMRATLGLRTITAGEVAEAVWEKLAKEKYAGKIARLVYEIIESGTAPKE